LPQQIPVLHIARMQQDGALLVAVRTELSVLSTYYLFTYRTYLFTSRNKVLLEKLTGLQIVKKLPAFYGTPRFIATFTSARHLSLS
jgi:hypothetical protein